MRPVTIFDTERNCTTCRHGFITFSSDDFPYHEICGNGRCHLCAERRGSCEDFEMGERPEEERDLWIR